MDCGLCILALLTPQMEFYCCVLLLCPIDLDGFEMKCQLSSRWMCASASMLSQEQRDESWIISKNKNYMYVFICSCGYRCQWRPEEGVGFPRAEGAGTTECSVNALKVLSLLLSLTNIIRRVTSLPIDFMFYEAVLNFFLNFKWHFIRLYLDIDPFY